MRRKSNGLQISAQLLEMNGEQRGERGGLTQMHSRGEAAFLIGRRSISRSRQEQRSRKPLRGESTCQEGVLVVGESEREMSSNPVLAKYRVARRSCGRPALSELGVKVSLHPAQALRTPL